MEACTHPPSIDSREVNEARLPNTCRKSCALDVRKKEKQHTNEMSLGSKTHRQKPGSAATEANSGRHAAKEVLHVSPSSPASLDDGFVEIGHAQLSQSMTMQNNAGRQNTTDRRQRKLLLQRERRVILTHDM